MTSHVATTLGVVLMVLGLVSTLQGFGLVGGSPTTGSSSRATAGPVIALVGLRLAVLREVGRRRD